LDECVNKHDNGLHNEDLLAIAAKVQERQTHKDKQNCVHPTNTNCQHLPIKNKCRKRIYFIGIYAKKKQLPGILDHMTKPMPAM
jgi:hypothetical protein